MLVNKYTILQSKYTGTITQLTIISVLKCLNTFIFFYMSSLPLELENSVFVQSFSSEAI